MKAPIRVVFPPSVGGATQTKYMRVNTWVRLTRTEGRGCS